LPRAIIRFPLSGAGQAAARDVRGRARGDPPPAVLPALERQEGPVPAVDRLDVRGARHREVADAGPVRAFPVLDAVDRLRHQTVDVEIALAVAVAAEVPRHAVDVRREVGAVVEVEPA